MRRSPSYLLLAAAVILLLVLRAATETEAIRLDAETRASVSVSSTNNPIVNKPSHDVVKGSTTSSVNDATRSTVAAGEVKAVAHSLPEFHEDYYVPNVHGPRHH